MRDEVEELTQILNEIKAVALDILIISITTIPVIFLITYFL